jgi:hypothetical protein
VPRTTSLSGNSVSIGDCDVFASCAGDELGRVSTADVHVDVAGRHVRQIELCLSHCEIVIERERCRGLEISDRRNE